MLNDLKCCKSLLSLNFLLLAVIFLLTFSPWLGISNTANSIITMLTAFLFMLIHGIIGWGVRNILVFLLITWIFSFCCEAIGVATGVIFGQYHYTDHLGPKLLGVPFMIQVSYVAMGYSSLMTARLILDIKGTPKQVTLFFSTLIGAMLMVGWDLCLDPFESTVSGDWIWHQGGPYYGIGIHNFVGWFFTVFIFMFIYQLFASYYPEKNQHNTCKAFWSQPLIYYAIMALSIILVPWVGGVDEPIASPANYTGTLHDLIYGLSLITVFTMGTPCLIALAKLFIQENETNE